MVFEKIRNFFTKKPKQDDNLEEITVKNNYEALKELQGFIGQIYSDEVKDGFLDKGSLTQLNNAILNLKQACMALKPRYEPETNEKEE